MKNYLAKRLLWMIPILIGISFFAFVLINLSPSDPAEVALRVNEVTPTPEVIAEMRAQLGLDKPFMTRYVTWLGNAVRGDFGKSYVNNRLVGEEIAINPLDVRQEYIERMQELTNLMHQALSACGVEYVRLTTDQDLLLNLRAFLTRRMSGAARK